MLALHSTRHVLSKTLMEQLSDETLELSYGHLSPDELIKVCDSNKDRARIAQLQMIALRSVGFESPELRSWLNVYTASLGESNHL
jgi:hypothetical protein